MPRSKKKEKPAEPKVEEVVTEEPDKKVKTPPLQTTKNKPKPSLSGTTVTLPDGTIIKHN